MVGGEGKAGNGGVERVYDKPRVPEKCRTRPRDLSCGKMRLFGRRLRSLRSGRFSAGLGCGRAVVEVRARDFRPWHKSVKIAADGPSLLQRQRAAERRHNRSSSFDNDPCPLGVRTRLLPAYVGEIRNTRDVPHPPAVHAMTANAVPVVEAGDLLLLLFRAAEPEPFPVNFFVVASRTSGAIIATALVAGARRLAAAAPGAQLVERRGLQPGGGRRIQGGANQEQHKDHAGDGDSAGKTAG